MEVQWNSKLQILCLVWYGVMVWRYGDAWYMLQTCLCSWYGGLVLLSLLVGQKISLQMCTLDLRQTVSNTLNMGFTGSLFPLRKKAGNFHHQTAFSCCKCLQIRLKWTPHQSQMVIILGGWCAEVSYVPLQAVHLPKSHFAGSGKCHHMEKKNDQKWRWAPTESCFK